MSEKIFHLQLQDSMKNKKSLVCYLKDGSLKYSHYTGWATSGIVLALRNMQVGYKNGSNLAVENLPGESKEQFTNRIVYMINSDSVCNVVNIVNTEVKFT